MKRTKAQISGKKWIVFVSEVLEEWDFDGSADGAKIAKMLNGHFSAEEIAAHKVSTLIWGREYGMLFPLAEEFLRKWGIPCRVENLPDATPEAPPLVD